MGQRLVIHIKDKGEEIANAYYHWSAYTGSAAELTNDILEYLNEADESFTNIQKAVWALYETGARFNAEEVYDMEVAGINYEQFSFVFDGIPANRNNGLLCVSEKGMDQNEYYEESRVEIDISDKEVYFGVICSELMSDYIKYCKEYNHTIETNLPVLDCDSYMEFDLNSWNKFYTQIKEILNKNKYTAKSPDGEFIYELIA